MSIFSDRIFGRPRAPGDVGVDGVCPSRTSTRLELFEMTLKAVEKQKGLLHGVMAILDETGKFAQGCALGAFANENKNNYIRTWDAEEIQKKNDSYPNATAAQRRQYMIVWLKKQILQMKSNAAQ